jgi:hypothetical protein
MPPSCVDVVPCTEKFSMGLRERLASKYSVVAPIRFENGIVEALLNFFSGNGSTVGGCRRRAGIWSELENVAGRWIFGRRLRLEH